MSNSETERVAIEHVLKLERAQGRQPEDVHLVRDQSCDIVSPPRKIEVKSFGGSARGEAIPLETRQVQAAQADPDNYYVYVVDNVARTDGTAMGVRVLHGKQLYDMLDRTTPQQTYWPTLRTAEYDNATQLQ